MRGGRAGALFAPHHLVIGRRLFEETAVEHPVDLFLKFPRLVALHADKLGHQAALALFGRKVAQHLLQIAAAARLMGATMLITGVSAAVAQTVVSLGVDFGAVKTLADLQLGLQEADRILAGEALGPAQANVRR